MANLDIIEREDLIGNAAKMGALLIERLRQGLADHLHMSVTCAEFGLMLGMEFVAEREVAAGAFKAGTYPHRQVQLQAAERSHAYQSAAVRQRDVSFATARGCAARRGRGGRAPLRGRGGGRHTGHARSSGCLRPTGACTPCVQRRSCDHFRLDQEVRNHGRPRDDFIP